MLRTLSVGLFCAAFVSLAVVAYPRSASAQTACCPPAVMTSPTPTPLLAYYLDGKQIYGTGGVPDSVVNHIVTNDPIDPNSSSVLNAQTGWVLQAGSNAPYFRNNALPTASPYPTPYTIAQATGGHLPVISTPCPTSDIVLCGTGAQVRWSGGNYYINGTCQLNCVQDDHFSVWDQRSNIITECNGANWNGTTLSAYSCIADNLNNSYCSQYGNKGDNVSVGGLAIDGFYAMSDDIDLYLSNATPINHPDIVVAAISSVASGTPGVNISPITTNNVGSCSGNPTTQCFQFGDLLRLKPSVVCPADPATNAKCVQWKTYGVYIAELGSIPGIHYGLDINGNDSTTPTLLSWQHALSWSADWDLIQRGTVHCP
jgi:hypothetical protein